MLDTIGKAFKDWLAGFKGQEKKLYYITLCGIMCAWLLYPMLMVNAAKPSVAATEIKELPYGDIPFGDGSISLTKVSTSSKESKSGFGYYPVVEVSFDISKLSQADQYWIEKDGNLKFAAIITSKENSIFDAQLTQNRIETADNTLKITFTDENEYRYKFDEMSVVLGFVVKSNEMTTAVYNGQKYETNKTNNYVYRSSQ